ncbi:MAG: acyl carrier protein [Bacteroidetes bacterium]|nr:acyl carrier protein [Bacteroidota bacterium]
MSTQDKIIDLVSVWTRIPSYEIHPYSHLKEDLRLDDFDSMFIILQLESWFNVILSIEDVSRIETIQDASKFIVKYLA